MKKTLLAVALLLASSCGFAQVNVNSATKDVQRDIKSVKTQKVPVQGVKVTPKLVKSVPNNATLLCDFSDESTFTIGVVDGYSNVTRAKWQYQTGSTNFTFTNSVFLTNFFGLPEHAEEYLGNDNYANMSYQNGLVYMDLRSLATVDMMPTVPINTWVKFNTPIYTYGKRGIDIYLTQSLYKWNDDQYFIDWSHDANFATYDSIEFDRRSIIDATLADGTICISLPQHIAQENGEADPNELISTSPEEATYIRIRCLAPAANSDNCQGIFFILDDIAYAETPELRLDVLNFQWLNGYTEIPEIVKSTDQLWSQASLENSGTDSLRVKLNNDMFAYHAPVSKKITSYIDSADYTYLGANTSDWDTITNEVYNDTSAIDGSITMLRTQFLGAGSKPQMFDENAMRYINETNITYGKIDNTWDTTINVSTYYYYKTPYNNRLTETANGRQRYSWSRDCGTTSAKYAMKDGFINSNGNIYYSDEANYNQAGYKVCLGFTGTEYDGDVYAKGVGLIAAIDSLNGTGIQPCAAGAAIKTSLMYWDTNATAMNEVIIPVEDDNEELVESDTYIIQSSDLNTDENADQYGRVSDNDFITTYVPFKQGNIKLNPNMTYYACYELVANGQFAVAKDYPYNNIYGAPFRSLTSSAFLTTVYSPGVSEEGDQYPWGRSASNILKGQCPMIHLVLGKDVISDASINEVNAEAAAMSVYPNPAVNNTVLNYTLNNSGNVVITITDVMGRVVMTMNKGKQNSGIDYRANISVKELANGTYFCTLNVNGAKSTTKLVVNK